MKVEEVQEIKDAILAVHGVDSRHVKSVPVVEHFEGKIAARDSRGFRFDRPSESQTRVRMDVPGKR